MIPLDGTRVRYVADHPKLKGMEGTVTMAWTQSGSSVYMGDPRRRILRVLFSDGQYRGIPQDAVRPTEGRL